MEGGQQEQQDGAGGWTPHGDGQAGLPRSPRAPLAGRSERRADGEGGASAAAQEGRKRTREEAAAGDSSGREQQQQGPGQQQQQGQVQGQQEQQQGQGQQQQQLSDFEQLLAAKERTLELEARLDAASFCNIVHDFVLDGLEATSDSLEKVINWQMEAAQAAQQELEQARATAAAKDARIANLEQQLREAQAQRSRKQEEQ